MKEVPLRRFTTVVPFLTEDVVITSAGKPIGTFTPLKEYEIMVDNAAKKAIEPDQVKKEPRGRLSKGLGELPGKPTGEDPYKAFRPVPKK